MWRDVFADFYPIAPECPAFLMETTMVFRLAQRVTRLIELRAELDRTLARAAEAEKARAQAVADLADAQADIRHTRTILVAALGKDHTNDPLPRLAGAASAQIKADRSFIDTVTHERDFAQGVEVPAAEERAQAAEAECERLRAELATLKSAQPEGKRVRTEVPEVPEGRRAAILRAVERLGSPTTAHDVARYIGANDAGHFADLTVGSIQREVVFVAEDGYLDYDEHTRAYRVSDKGRTALTSGPASGPKVGDIVTEANVGALPVGCEVEWTGSTESYNARKEGPNRWSNGVSRYSDLVIADQDMPAYILTLPTPETP